MSRKYKVIGILGFIVLLLVVSYSVFQHLKVNENVEAVEKKVLEAIRLNNVIISHVEFIDDDYALAFYEWGYTYAGVAELEKTAFGWNVLTSISDSFGQSPYFVELSHFSVLFGVGTDELRSGEVELNNGSKHPLSIEGGELAPEFWFFYSDNADLSRAKVINKDGEVRIEIDHKPNQGLERQIE